MKSWGTITLEPVAGTDIEAGAKEAYEFMINKLDLSYGWEFRFNDKVINMTPFEDYHRVFKKPSEIIKEYWEGKR